MGKVYLINAAHELLVEGSPPSLPEIAPLNESLESAARLFAFSLGLRPGRLLNRGDDFVSLLVDGQLEDAGLEFWPFDRLEQEAPDLASEAQAALGRSRSLIEACSQLPASFVVVPAWVSLSGSILYADPDREPNDVDVVVRADEIPQGVQLKLTRLIQHLFLKNPHFVTEATGPSWSHLPVYDLVAVRREPLEIVEINEPEFASDFYKAEEAKPGKYIGQYGVAGEFYAGDEDQIWDKWARRAVERGVKILVQEKYDGFRFHVHKWRGGFRVFSDKGHDRSKVFPYLEEIVPDDVVFDAEFVQEGENGPVERWEMGWMGSANQPPDPFPRISIYVHDLLYANGESLIDRPYSERLEEINKLFKNDSWRGKYRLVAAKTKEAGSEDALKEAIAWARGQPGSEGAMLKFSDFRYLPKVLAEVAKLKSTVEIDCRVIGWRKVPRAKPTGEKWSRAEAMAKLSESLAESDTYILRVAVRDGDKLIPLESDQKLTAQDLTLDWDEGRQVWVGTDDPKLWKMCPGFPQRSEGEYQYANTYARAFDKEPDCSTVVTVAPMRFRPFKRDDGSTGYAWMFPRVKNEKPKGSQVGQLKDILTAFKVEKADHTPVLAIVGDGPGEQDELMRKPFSGRSGKFLKELLAELGIDEDRIYFTNVYKTRAAKLSNASFAQAAQALRDELSKIKSLKAILALSELAAAALTGLRRPFADLRDVKFEINGVPVVVSFHPAYLLRTGGRESKHLEDFKADLERALRLSGLMKASLAHSTSHYPDENVDWRFVIQVHFRGQSAHADFRCQIAKEILEGWTLAVQQEGQIKQPVLSLEEARSALKNAQAWKLDWEKGSIYRRQIETTIGGEKRQVVRPGGLWATPKRAEIVASWLNVEGRSPDPDPGEPPPVGATVRFPAVFLIADKGRVEFGARKPWFFEYFLDGEHFKGRYVVRAVERQEKADEPVLSPGKPDETRGAPMFWKFSQAAWPPYVLSDEAVEKGWMPPKGVSCLPEFIRKKIPEKLRYWEMSGEDALAARKELAQSFEELARDW